MALIPAGPDRQLRCRWENGYAESLNARPRDELLDGEVFHSLREPEAEVVVEGWRCHHNQVRPHASLGYRAPAPGVIAPASAAIAPASAASPRPASPANPAVAAGPVTHQHSPRTTRRGPAKVSHHLHGEGRPDLVAGRR